ncbi:HTH_48 domain-containing protein [Trichonephila clavata]|uniref:HTH_48 domain-containing protein n=1 Tax=Trichonephila clavata TaxID=2740835 RepID=A0A8X6FXZ4_TRICU|nr:HTH_48 domain-containing protein [Trichonephila clavata]
MGESLGNNALSYRTVARWVGKFQQGRVSTSDEQRSGRPLSVRTDLASAVIVQLMDEDRRWMLLELERASRIKNAYKRIVLSTLLCTVLSFFCAVKAILPSILP